MRCWPADTRNRRHESLNRQSSASLLGGPGALHQLYFFSMHGWRRLDAEADNILAAQNNEAEGALVCRAIFESAQLLALLQHEVHVAVERDHLAHQDAAVVESYFEAVVEQRQDAGVARHGLLD